MTYLDATNVHATPDDIHEPTIEGMPTAALEERYFELVEFGAGRASVDPSCGCRADNGGAPCYWDDPDQIDDELGRRGR